MFKTHKWLKIIGIVVTLIILALVFFVVRPDTYIPHKRITLHVPYDLNDPATNLLPMGEKIYHANAPSGHPGLDLQWNHPDAKILAAADGKITKIKQEFDKWDKWQIDVETWPYIVRYKEMETYNTNLKVGQQVKTGDYLGIVANPKLHNIEGAYQIHWELASVSLIRDRFCPMSYFDEASKQAIQKAWNNTNWQYKSQYPDICNGDYAGKTD